MTKSFTGALVALIAVVGLTACSNNDTDTSQTKVPAQEQTADMAGTSAPTDRIPLTPAEAKAVFSDEVSAFLVALKTTAAGAAIDQKALETAIAGSNLAKIGALPSATLNGSRATIMADIDNSHCMVTVDLTAEKADLTSAACMAGASMGKDTMGEGDMGDTPSASTPAPTSSPSGK